MLGPAFEPDFPSWLDDDDEEDDEEEEEEEEEVEEEEEAPAFESPASSAITKG